ncbi:MAG TPA: trypsin-like peptidase domain-containing protein [Thermoanaerobaculia bacterium]|nr:trypsin-like peptidase domain-containing protein [Thermoanaerobaculia bacterium]
MTRFFRAVVLASVVPALLFAVDLPTPEPLRVTMDVADLAIIDAPPPTERRLLVGVTKAANAEVDFSGVTAAMLAGGGQNLAFGRIEKTDAGFRWTGQIESSGASALRVHFTEFNLPSNATLTLSNGLGEAYSYAGRGPLDSGEFWSNTVGGDSVVVTVNYAGNDVGRVLQALRFMVADIGPLSSKFPVADEQASTLCSYNVECIENAGCGTLPSAVTVAREAAAMILFVSGPYQYICSGGLVADGDTSTHIPYFLTANHCLSSSTSASSLEAYFDYKIACGGTCPSSLGAYPRVLGSTVSATNKTSDFTLLRLNAAAPAYDGRQRQFLATNNTAVSGNHNLALYRISHPAGAPQAYSAQTVDTSRPTCRSWPRGSWIYSSDTYGATEGGSSGSPVVNASGQVVGQLSGACGYNVNDPCDTASNATVDGALAAYWSQVEPFLGGGDGGGCSPTTEVCDGVDNDCDGEVDEGGVCDTGGCTVGGSGAPCTANGDCCSGNCKGKPGAKTCK